MLDKSLFYQESGKADALRLLLVYLVSLVIVLGLSYAYSVVSIFIPFIYVSFAITVILSITLGYLVKFLLRIAHIRGANNRYVLAIVIGVMANYFQWTTYLLYAIDDKIPSFVYFLENLAWIIVPSTFFSIIAAINEVGLWEVFGIQFQGFVLGLVWVIEALAIMAGPIVAVYTTQVYPFSEQFKRWYPKFTIRNHFQSIATVLKLTEDLQEDPLKTIQELKMGDGIRYTKIHVYYLEHEENQYLSFEKVFIDKRGEGKKRSTFIIHNFKISTPVAKSILDAFDYKRERIEVV
jgi:ribosomal protein L19